MLKFGKKAVPERSEDDTVGKAMKRVKQIAKSIRKANIRFLVLAKGSVEVISATLASEAHASKSLMRTTAFFPTRVSLYLPLPVCSIKADKLRM